MKFGLALFIASALWVMGQQPPLEQGGAKRTAVQMVITVESPKLPVAVNKGDIHAFQGNDVLPITNLVPLQGNTSNIELYVVVDDRLKPHPFAPRLKELRRFILSQPAATAVGIAYMVDGDAVVAIAPTPDHERAADSLRVPTGGTTELSSPYYSLVSLIDKWPAGPAQREVVMISDGEDLSEEIGEGRWVGDLAAAEAERAGIPVFCLYAPTAGRANHDPDSIRDGQAVLANVAAETGAQAYFREAKEQAFTFEPYLADISARMAQQYRVTFLAIPDMGSQGLAGVQALLPVAFRTTLPEEKVTAASHFYLIAASPTNR